MTTTTEPVFDKKDQLQKIEAALIPGEHVIAVFDMKGGGTGFLGITSKRLIVYDKQFLRKIKALVSIPYDKVHSVGAEDDSGLFSGRGFFSSSKLAIHTASGDFEFEFRGAEKAHQAHQMIMQQFL